MNKKQYGQYFTKYNVFEHDIFTKWLKSKNIETPILEPFAGGNNIPYFLQNNDWNCFDIDITHNNKCPQFKITQQNTIENFPVGYDMCITNPPYLAKVSATRNKLKYTYNEYDDLYEKCLELCLKNCKYVAAIIPETFIRSKRFKDRLEYVISLNRKCFDDTACPCCLALFGEKSTDDFEIYDVDSYIGSYNTLKENVNKLFYYNRKYDIKINDPNGNLGCICIDNTTSSSIRFCYPSEITRQIKVSSRMQTIMCIDGITVDDNFLDELNKLLKEYRYITNDIFLASFKNLRKDSKYRRRLDFETIKQIINTVLSNEKI